jgi:hypothetical protein
MTLGLYTDFGSVETLAPFLKACGYNALEFCNASTLHPPDKREGYHRKMVEGVRQAHRAGMRAYIIILSNVGPVLSADEPLEASHYSPRDKARMRVRLDAIAEEVKLLREADGFAFFAGDPGGDPARKADVRDCVAMARQVREIVAREAPKAQFIFNAWAIAAWDQWTSPHTVDFWEKETSLTRQVIAEPDWIGAGVGIEFPMHNAYRSLALKCYADAGKQAVVYPTRTEVDEIRGRGTTILWGWPYFLMDECDDGFTGGSWGAAQAEARYLHKVAADGRALGLNGMVGNLSWKSADCEVLNVYAFARFVRDPGATPAGVLREFAGVLAEEGSAGDLARVLAFIENHRTWHESLPVRDRLPDLDCGGLDTPEKAQESLRGVRFLERGAIPLPVKPAEYAAKLAQRLKVLAGDRRP